MELSIIIPVHNDLRIKRCIESIDENVEVIASMNRPTQEIQDLVKSLGIDSCTIDRCNLSMAYNVGMDTATYNRVLFMDSDCVFTPGTISKLYEEMENNLELKLCRGRVEFKYNSYETKLTQRARKVNTSDAPFAFIPPLMLEKDVFGLIDDGYRFAEDVVWCGDYEFELRRSKANIPLKIRHDATIIHEPITMKSDFKSAFMYGTGKRIRHERTDEKVSLIEVLKYPIYEGLKKEGPLIAGYLALWKAVLYSGYYCQKYFDYQGRKGNRIDKK
jgi:glycosyltransferase involved in cell wall biosynthesis